MALSKCTLLTCILHCSQGGSKLCDLVHCSQGVKVCELIASFDSLKQEVLRRDHDVGFAGETIDVISHALNMLGSRLVKMEPSIDISLL